MTRNKSRVGEERLRVVSRNRIRAEWFGEQNSVVPRTETKAGQGRDALPPEHPVLYPQRLSLPCGLLH